MTAFALDNATAIRPAVAGPYGVIARARLYAPDGSTVADLALAESPAGTYSGSVALTSPADSPGEAYEYEVRQVSAQNPTAFDASTTVLVSRGTYAYLAGGQWYAFDATPDAGAVTLTLTWQAAPYPTAVVLTALSRTDTGAAVDFGSGAFTADPDVTGRWSVQWAAPAPGLSYAYTAVATIGGADYEFSGVKADGGAAYVGRYTSSDRLDVRLNQLNLTVYTDLDSDGVRDPAAVQQVIENAEARVDFYTGGAYGFTGGSPRDQTVARGTFARWSDEMAVDEAVAKRIPITSEGGLALERRVALVIKEMTAFRQGNAVLPGAVPDNPADPDDGDDAGEVSFIDIDFGRGRCGNGDEFAGRC